MITLNLISFLIYCWIFNVSLQFVNIFTKKDKNGWLSFPIDFNKKFIDKKPILGKGRTFGGLFFVILTILLLNLFSLISLKILTTLGISVFMGDLIGSFIKRRAGFEKGKFLPLVDHGDYIIIAGIVSYNMEIITLKTFLCALLINYIIHPIWCWIGYKLKIKNDPW